MKRIIVLIGMVFVFLACTGDFKEINTDKSGVTDEDLQADYNEHGIRLGIIQQGIYFNYDYGKGKNWPFQLTQNLNADTAQGLFCRQLQGHDPRRVAEPGDVGGALSGKQG